MITSRHRKGLRLSNRVQILDDDEALIVLEVPGSDERYRVTIYEDCLRCECPDYQYRNDPSGSFLCKHCYAAIEYLTRTEREGGGCAET